MTTDEAELRQEIERTREQLGETVAGLAAKMDVKERAKENRLPLIVAGAALAALAAYLIARRVRSR
jgi:hypothetical protein